MSVSDMFKTFLDNIKVERSAQFSQRYGEITKSLNQALRNTDSNTDNSLQVGSYGRYTGIKGISDLDMLYIMPKAKWNDYKDNKQSKLLTDVKDAIKARYPKTDVRVDRLVVTVAYQNFHVEVQPVFEETDEDGESYFKYPDTYKGGSWKDRSYWLNPATRRYKEQAESSNDIGFRCAVDRVGSDKGNNNKSK